MLLIRVILIISAVVVILYPVWGLIDPGSYLVEILESYPFANEASDSQVRQAALLLWLSNIMMSLALFFLAQFIRHPKNYYLAKYSAFTLIFYPIILTVVQIASGFILSSHLDKPFLSLEFSAIKGFYMLFGLAVFGIYKTQRGLNKPLELTEPALADRDS